MANELRVSGVMVNIENTLQDKLRVTGTMVNIEVAVPFWRRTTAASLTVEYGPADVTPQTPSSGTT